MNQPLGIPFVDVNYKQLPFQFYNNRYLPTVEKEVTDEKEDVQETDQANNEKER